MIVDDCFDYLDSSDPAEGDVIKAAHEDKDYIYPALEISDFDGNAMLAM